MTIITVPSPASFSDIDLLAEIKRLARDEREATARLVAFLGELDARRLYPGEGCSSVFAYCTQVLHLSEHAAYGRIEAARAGRRFPIILERLGAPDRGIPAGAAPHRTEPSAGARRRASQDQAAG
jgi:hypothetical protein